MRAWKSAWRGLGEAAEFRFLGKYYFFQLCYQFSHFSLTWCLHIWGQTALFIFIFYLPFFLQFFIFDFFPYWLVISHHIFTALSSHFVSLYSINFINFSEKLKNANIFIFFLQIILGNVNVSILNRNDKVRYKDDYEKFKLILNVIGLLMAFLNLIFNYRWVTVLVAVLM